MTARHSGTRALWALWCLALAATALALYALPALSAVCCPGAAQPPASAVQAAASGEALRDKTAPAPARCRARRCQDALAHCARACLHGAAATDGTRTDAPHPPPIGVVAELAPRADPSGPSSATGTERPRSATPPSIYLKTRRLRC